MPIAVLAMGNFFSLKKEVLRQLKFGLFLDRFRMKNLSDIRFLATDRSYIAHL
jgi:hypothetical protein